MKTFEMLTVGNKTYNLKITVGQACKLEKELGSDLLTVSEKLSEVNILAQYYFAALVSFNDDINSIEDVYQLLDDYVTTGGHFEDLQLLMMKVLVVSGILTEKASDIMQKVAAKQQQALEKIAEGKTAEALGAFLEEQPKAAL